ncbi:expressed unknown protein [Seminavis robusta]|uniref:Uncharacterized protein n=1 Tax=Seminavis robusta TaxID=568900 RepID=A0A9N8HQ36_9STRA|nr:expressed unknown protein [Seminavis robusta]|eukprot:Sro1154_g247110.1 n/a (181) ;mRNA; f:10471-11013
MSITNKQVTFGSSSYHVLEDDGVIITEEHKSLLWYDRQSIQDNLQSLLSNKENTSSNDDSAFSEQSRRRRDHHVKSVLSMQSEIEDTVGIDTTGLRAFAMALSKDQVKTARARAAQGATDAYEVYQQAGYTKERTVQEFCRTTPKLLRAFPKKQPRKTHQEKETLRHDINQEALRLVWAM